MLTSLGSGGSALGKNFLALFVVHCKSCVQDRKTIILEVRVLWVDFEREKLYYNSIDVSKLLNHINIVLCDCFSLAHIFLLSCISQIWEFCAYIPFKLLSTLYVQELLETELQQSEKRLTEAKGIWFWNLTRSINNMSVRKPILNSKKFQLTLFKYGLAFAPKRFIRSVARNKPTAVIKSIFSIGINATINRSRNPIVNFFTELKWSVS